jgi:hypothetical protein
MKKKLLVMLGAGALTVILSSCWALQSFTVLDYTLTPGQATKARFTLRPWTASTAANNIQFVIVGVPTGGDIAVGKATWGTNNNFGGPMTMNVSAGFTAAMGNQCASNGLDFADITGMTWKAFLTPVSIRDRGRVEQRAIVDVVVRAKADAGTGLNSTIFGVPGRYMDDGDGILNSSDSFQCWGLASSSLYVKAA